MNKGTRIRTALRVAFSIYTAFCMWQVSITKLSEQLHLPWLVALCAIVIVVSGLVVDALTTYFNNDFTKEACEGTGITRQRKAEKEVGYVGELFFDGGEPGDIGMDTEPVYGEVGDKLTTEEAEDEHDDI